MSSRAIFVSDESQRFRKRQLVYAGLALLIFGVGPSSFGPDSLGGFWPQNFFLTYIAIEPLPVKGCHDLCRNNRVHANAEPNSSAAHSRVRVNIAPFDDAYPDVPP